MLREKGQTQGLKILHLPQYLSLGNETCPCPYPCLR